MELLAHDEGPTATLTYSGNNQKAERGTSCWTQPAEGGVSSGSCADAAGVSIPDQPLLIPSGTLLRLTGDGTHVSASVGKYVDKGGYGDLDDRHKLDVSDGTEPLDLPAGDYVLDVFARWDQGDSVFDFSIRLT
jgi:hypothetical protein